jgi:hypothetical protein
LSILQHRGLLSQTCGLLNFVRAWSLCLNQLVAGRKRLALYSRTGQDDSGAKGHRRTSHLERNATLFALNYGFSQLAGIEMQRRDHVSGGEQP